MNNIQNIIIYLGSNLKEFVVSVFIRFLLYIALITIFLAVFFSSIRIINDGLFAAGSFILLIAANFFINRKILISRFIGILNRYPLNRALGEEDQGKFSPDQWKATRKEVKGKLRRSLRAPAPMDFTDCLTVYTLLSGEYPENREAGVKELFNGHIRQKFLEWGISLITALPFISISLLFTAGYRFEMKLLSLIMAVIFFLFIRSAIITPVFALITLDKISEKFSGNYNGPQTL